MLALTCVELAQSLGFLDTLRITLPENLASTPQLFVMTNLIPFPPVYTAWPGTTTTGSGFTGVTGSGFTGVTGSTVFTYKVAPTFSAEFFVDSFIVVLAPIFSTDS